MHEDLELAVMRLAWRLDSLDKWREVVDGRVRDLDEGMRRMVNAQEIAEAVAARLSARNRLELTLAQKLIGGNRRTGRSPGRPPNPGSVLR